MKKFEAFLEKHFEVFMPLFMLSTLVLLALVAPSKQEDVKPEAAVGYGYHQSAIRCSWNTEVSDYLCVVKATGETLSTDEAFAYLERS